MCPCSENITFYAILYIVLYWYLSCHYLQFLYNNFALHPNLFIYLLTRKKNECSIANNSFCIHSNISVIFVRTGMTFQVFSEIITHCRLNVYLFLARLILYLYSLVHRINERIHFFLNIRRIISFYWNYFCLCSLVVVIAKSLLYPLPPHFLNLFINFSFLSLFACHLK